MQATKYFSFFFLLFFSSNFLVYNRVWKVRHVSVVNAEKLISYLLLSCFFFFFFFLFCRSCVYMYICLYTITKIKLIDGHIYFSSKKFLKSRNIIYFFHLKLKLQFICNFQTVVHQSCLYYFLHFLKYLFVNRKTSKMRCSSEFLSLIRHIYTLRKFPFLFRIYIHYLHEKVEWKICTFPMSWWTYSQNILERKFWSSRNDL